MRALIFSSILLTTISMSAHASETVAAADWEDAKYNVAQVVDTKPIKGLTESAQLTSVYRGGIAAPFGVYLSVWDPIPQEGSDFGSVKTFDLGNFSDTPKVISKRIRKVNKNVSVLELTLKTSIPDDSMTGITPVTLKLSVAITGGEVQNSLNLQKSK